MNIQVSSHTFDKVPHHGKARNEDGGPPYPRLETIATQAPSRKQQAQHLASPLKEPPRPGVHATGGQPFLTERRTHASGKPADTPQWAKTQDGRETAVLDACASANIEPETVGERPQPQPTLRPGSRECECTVCGLFFGSPTAFDLHRVGNPDDRRCLTPAEMNLRGMEQNGRGMWVRPYHRPRAGALQPPVDRASANAHRRGGGNVDQ